MQALSRLNCDIQNRGIKVITRVVLLCVAIMCSGPYHPALS